jgi:hypothetical protein
MLHRLQESARVCQRSIILNCHSFHVRFEMTLGQRDCDCAPQQETRHGSEYERGRDCGPSGEWVFLLFLLILLIPHKHLTKVFASCNKV